MSRLILFALSLLMSGCFYPPPEELDRSVFIPDDQYPDLPAYSEWGYNTYGAFYNNSVFLYTPTLTASVTKDTLTFSFYGSLKGNKYEGTNIYFSLPGKNPSSYSDLVTLHATTFDLASSTAFVTLGVNGEKLKGTISTGSLIFKRAQYLLVNSQPDRVILSGYFDFQFITIDNKTITVKNGRFDIGINDLNFYNY